MGRILNTNVSWFEKYRPTEIENMVFDNEKDRTIVKRWIDNKTIDGNVLLFGPPGCGKTTLTEILIKTIIHASNDIYRIKTRSVKEIDDNVKPFLKRSPVRSKIKIVYFEEFDKMSSQAEGTLKEDCLEKYQSVCSFLCTTNYIKKIDHALLTRFNYKILLTNANIEAVSNRLEFILKSEKCEFEKDKLIEFVTNHSKKGLRDLINILQIESIQNNKKINFETNLSTSNLEETISELVLNILKTVINIKDMREKKLCQIYPDNTAISKDYKNIYAILHNNYDLDYSIVYELLLEKNNYLPIQIILAKYAEDNERKKYPHIHLISCLYKLIKCVTDIF